MEDLLQDQEAAMKAVARALPNLKRLGQGNFTVAKLQSRMSSLKELFNRCQQNHWRLQSLMDKKSADLPYFKDELFLKCEEDYNNTLDFIAEWLHTLDSSRHTSSPLPTNASFVPPDIVQRSSFQLPRINLPTYAGDFHDWESFRDKFKALIINDPSLSDVTRLHYLGSCLKGEASDLIRHLPITDANFNIAWHLVSTRYDNKRRLINLHLQSLHSLPLVTVENASELQNLRDKANTAIQALKNLDRPIDSWDDMLVFLVVAKLDKSSRKAWELKLGSSLEYPTYLELEQFLDSRIRALDALPSVPKQPKRTVQSHAATASQSNCPLCHSEHLLNACPQFKAKTAPQRFEFIKRAKRCLNCFSARHSLNACTSKYTCQKCKRKHHTLLHFDTVSREPEDHAPPRDTSDDGHSASITSHLLSKAVSPTTKVLLATAWIQVSTSSGRKETVRALLDQGSVTTLMTENLAQRLRVPRRRVSVAISGIGDTESTARHATTICIAPTNGLGPSYSTTALILKSLTRYVPQRTDQTMSWPHIRDLTLADKYPMSSDPIEILLGADVYGFVLLDGIRSGSLDEPIAQNSIFGWILSGPVNSRASGISPSIPAFHCASLDPLDTEIRRFWEIEEIPRKSHVTAEEQQCEDHFLATHSRDATGRYIVRLPFRRDPPLDIGESEAPVRSMLSRLERRLQAHPALQAEYNAFLAEYLSLGHMTRVPRAVHPTSQIIYIPHHAVVRESSATTRLRVVFNASSLTSNGTSLNDHLLTGPKLQTDLPSVILRWRQYRYVFTADIAKMYRQILIDSRDVDYQRILWRSSPSLPIEVYQLRTVTYGTAPAPYLALRVLQQLVKDEGAKFPLALPVLRHHIYVDDCVFGADTKPAALETRKQLIELLNKAHFPLRKWASNCSELLQDVSPNDYGLACNKSLQVDDNIKVLGVSWNPATDTFQFRVTISPPSAYTKRVILSTIARLFDPLGWVTPATIVAKILMQDLWREKCAWDDSLPTHIRARWDEYSSELPNLESVSIPRWTKQSPGALRCELHGFADASIKAYAAVVYLRTVTSSGQVVISILTAKSKVAPVKPLTVPRLELSAALLLSRLLAFVRDTLKLHTNACYCWTDSTITLWWVTQPPSRWKTFIANRVAEIQTRLPHAFWRHVATEDNPADCASRGVLPSNLLSHDLWWNGPMWLRRPASEWPQYQPTAPMDSSLAEPSNVPVHLAQATPAWDLAGRYSSWPKLVRVSAYVMRFVQRTRHPVSPRQLSPPTVSKATLSPVALHPAEIQKAKVFWLQSIQKDLFFEELQCLVQQRPIGKRSALLSLNPFLDDNHLIRVGGRLKNSELSDEEKHPIILKAHPIVSLLIVNAHLRALHAGPKLTLSILRHEYWLLRGRPTVRSIIHQCLTCARAAAAQPQQLMGDLPDVRVTRSSRAFLHCGLDYAGPILIKTSSGRGYKAHKSYIALFVCMVVKAVHLELVSDYSTAAFISAYNRFCSRRGLPKTMYSDNGTTFQGANRELTEAFRRATRDPTVLNKLATDGVKWCFIPPSAPHFGGLWEAGIRSLKYHVKRVVGAHTLTFEEFSTLLCQVEACLNSRPIAALSDHIDDYSALTPGHFLIGSALTAVPAPSLLDLKESRLSRWQLIQKMSESVWRQWSRDYLQGLQQRAKWRNQTPNLAVGQLVLLRHPNLPPCQWELGRVTECHPGADGIVRVVTVKTANSEYKRPIVKLCILPVDLPKATP